jgi:biopolymer transport protein ExbB/TolQ
MEMKTLIFAGLLVLSSISLAQTPHDSVKVSELNESLQEMLEETTEWAERMQLKLDEFDNNGHEISEEEWQEMEQRIERKTQSFEMRMEAWTEEMEQWGERYGSSMEARGENFARRMERWAESFAREMEEMAREMEENYQED